MPTSQFDNAFASVISTPFGTRRYWVRYQDGFSETRTARSGNGAKARYFVKWDDADLIRIYSLGVTIPPLTPGTANFDGWMFRRFLPAMHPRRPLSLRADKFDWVTTGCLNDGATVGSHSPDATANNWFKNDWVEFDVTYVETPRMLYSSDAAMREYFIDNPDLPISEVYRYVSRRWRSVPKERRVPGYGFETYNPATPTVGGTRIEEVGFVPYTDKQWIYTWNQVPYNWIPFAAIDACSLRVNKTYDGTVSPTHPRNLWDRKFPPGTLRFDGLATEVDPYFGPDETLYADVSYSFSQQPNGWNYVPPARDPSGPWLPLRAVEGTPGASPPVPLYGDADFHTLFRASPTESDPW